MSLIQNLFKQKKRSMSKSWLEKKFISKCGLDGKIGKEASLGKAK